MSKKWEINYESYGSKTFRRSLQQGFRSRHSSPDAKEFKRLCFSLRLEKTRKDEEDISSVLKELETQSGSTPETLARSLQYRNIITVKEFQDYIKSRSSDINSDILTAYKKVK